MGRTVKRIIIFLLISIAVLSIGLLIAIPISNHLHSSYYDIVFVEGIIVTVFSLYFSIQGNPSGGSLFGMGSKNAQYIANSNMETTRNERKSTGYFQNFTDQNVLNMTLRKFAIVLGGVLLIIYSALAL